jgi:hypothetical protein
MDSADLACESEVTEEEASAVREYIRKELADALQKQGDHLHMVSLRRAAHKGCG